MRRLLSLSLLLAAAGCVRDPDPISFSEPSLAVHGLVRAGDTQVRVSLLRAPGSESLPTDATVTLETGGSSVTLAPVPDSLAQGCFGSAGFPAGTAHRCYGAQLAHPVAPGEIWHLRATVASGELVTGTTSVPAQPAVLRPAPLEHVAFTPGPDNFVHPVEVPVQWQTPAATRVEFTLGGGRVYQGGKLLTDVACGLNLAGSAAAVDQPSGSRSLLLEDVYCFPTSPTANPGLVAWDSIAAEVLVTAYDSAYAEFALHGESVTHSSSAAALHGAFGVFGSAATTRREIMLVRH